MNLSWFLNEFINTWYNFSANIGQFFSTKFGQYGTQAIVGLFAFFSVGFVISAMVIHFVRLFL